MSANKDLSAEERARELDILVAIMRLERQERYLTLLKHAQRIRQNNNLPDVLSDIIRAGEIELHSLHSHSTGRPPRRKRPQKSISPDNCCLVFIDECGAPSLLSKDPFDVFVISAVIIPETDYPKIDKQWKRWKHDNLGTAKKFVHEPNVRKGSGPFYFKGDNTKRADIIQSLNELLSRLEFSTVACVLNKQDYIARFGANSMDKSLPEHPYLMTLDFLLERMLMILEIQFNCAHAKIIAEARGSREDALLQYEYVRLQLDGTSYVSPAWFRQQLSPAIEFKVKSDNNTGLQLADLFARPCGEKILDPTSTPPRWSEFRNKLCLGQETLHSILGLKIVPWHDRYVNIWKS